MHKPKHIVIISDLHAGSQYAPWPEGLSLQNGGELKPSKLQALLNKEWSGFWRWVMGEVAGEPFDVVMNGDMVEGVHHGTKEIQTAMMDIHIEAATALLKPWTMQAQRTFLVYGTEAHVGKSSEYEEMVGRSLQTEINPETRRRGSYELWLRFGDELLHFSHHISTTTRAWCRANALSAEIESMMAECGRQHEEPPTIMVRSHRHMYVEALHDKVRCFTTPAWQTPTAFVWKIDRSKLPAIGGVLLSLNDKNKAEVKPYVVTIKTRRVVR